MGTWLFERPYTGIVAAVVVEVVLLISWSMRRDRTSALLLLVGPAAVGILLGLDALVATPRERIEQTVKQLVERAETEDVEGMMSLVSERFVHQDTVRKESVRIQLRQLLNGNVIQSNAVTRLEVMAADERGGWAGVSVRTFPEPEGRFAYFGLIVTRWKMWFVRDADGVYRLSDIELEAVNEQPGVDIFGPGVTRGDW